MPTWKPPPPVLLDLPCTGFLSDPPTDCHLSIGVPMPFDVERLRRLLDREGWLVSVVSPPGENPPRVTALCGACAEILIPELAKAAREHMQRNKP